MKYIVINKYTNKTYYVFNNMRDAKNAIAHLEDMYGIDYRNIEIKEEA